MSDWNTTEGWNSGFSGAAQGAAAGMSVGGPIGAIVGGLGGLAGGLFGFKKKTDWQKKSFNESVRQFNVQDDYNKNRLQYTVKDAIKAGVNPVAALGAGSGHYSPTISAGGGSDNSESSNFVGNASAIAGMFSKEARQNRAIELESSKLDLESKRLQNDILRSKLLAETQPGIPTSGQRNSIQDLLVPFRTPDGKIVYRLNQDAVPDTDITNISTWQTVGDDPGSISSWLREVILPRKGSWNDRYLPGYAWGRKLIGGLL